jgi:hypothetical protein
MPGAVTLVVRGLNDRSVSSRRVVPRFYPTGRVSRAIYPSTVPHDSLVLVLWLVPPHCR